jgi:hypothetical protein
MGKSPFAFSRIETIFFLLVELKLLTLVIYDILVISHVWQAWLWRTLADPAEWQRQTHLGPFAMARQSPARSHRGSGAFGAANLPTFNEALKTGVDPITASPAYVAAAGSGTRDRQSLHRIDPEVIKVEVTTAGFMLEAESNALMNPSDDLAVRSRQGASQVMLRFRKPR